MTENFPLASKPYVETKVVMAKYKPLFDKADMTNRRNQTQPTSIEACEEAENIQPESSFPHLRKNKHEQTAKHDIKQNGQNYNASQKGFRDLPKKNHECPANIPKQRRIRSLCRYYRHLDVGKETSNTRLLDTGQNVPV